MTTNSKFWQPIFAFAFITLLILGFYIRGVFNTKKILENPVISNGIVYEFDYGYRQSYIVSYYFIAKGKMIYGVRKGPEYKPLRSLIVGKSFPVVYSSKDFSNNSLLIFPDDFTQYKLSFPDSLAWVKKFQ